MTTPERAPDFPDVRGTDRELTLDEAAARIGHTIDADIRAARRVREHRAEEGRDE